MKPSSLIKLKDRLIGSFPSNPVNAHGESEFLASIRFLGIPAILEFLVSKLHPSWFLGGKSEVNALIFVHAYLELCIIVLIC